MVDGGLDHDEYKLNGRLHVKFLFYSDNRDKILVVLDQGLLAPPIGKMLKEVRGISYPSSLFFVETVHILKLQA